MGEDKKCFLCGSECEIYPAPLMHNIKDYKCKYCGPYLLDDFFIATYQPCNIDKFKMACILNERRLKGLGGVALSNKTDKNKMICSYPQISFDELLGEFPKKASEFLNRALLNLSRLPESTQPFGVIKLDLATNKGGLHLFIQDEQGCRAFLRELAEQGYIRFNTTLTGSIQYHVFFLTVRFWEAIENFQNTGINNKRAFVAMWFDPSMDRYYLDGIKPAIEKAGYVPVKIVLQEFNGKICDEIIAEIKRCKFLISDFSGQRGGVYFEAGYAMGQGKAVIFAVKEDEVKDLHFDTRQYNHIVYDSPEDLCKKLYNRINATIV